MTHYEYSLRAMERLLTSVGEQHWADWIRQDIQRWSRHGDVSHHLGAYGGMGSFNDLVICRANGHEVTEAQEPWVFVLFDWLKSLCHHLAHNPNAPVRADALKQSMGRHDSALAAFVGGDEAPDESRGFAFDTLQMSGWRCLHCGYAEVTAGDVERFVADVLTPDMVFRACEDRSLTGLVERILALDIPEADKHRRRVTEAARASGIEISDRTGWMRPCPKCGDNDTAVYRWQVDAADPPRFVPCDNNLPVRA